MGDSIKGTRFKVAKFVEKYQPNKYGTNVDVSELTLEQEETHQQLMLVKEKVTTSPESVATFVYASTTAQSRSMTSLTRMPSRFTCSALYW